MPLKPGRHSGGAKTDVGPPEVGASLGRQWGGFLLAQKTPAVRDGPKFSESRAPCGTSQATLNRARAIRWTS
jgi:hypothetical protein